MPTSIDVFAKAREFERLEILNAARELDMLPYFRVLEGPTLPVVEMEGAARVMLGSNNYLGLTGDERVKQGALDALHRYGTGITGSRFLNGTLDLHLELERELAEWMGTEAALVILLGCEERLLPAWQSLCSPDPEALCEERRLFYVAATRAKDRLVLTHVRIRAGRDTAGPSRFLYEAGLLSRPTRQAA